MGPKRLKIDLEKVKSIPYEQRETIKSLAAAMSMAPTTMHRHIGYGSFSWSPSVIKPVLSEAHKLARIKYALNNLIPRPDLNMAIFKECFNTIHVDEKWFYLRKPRRGVYLAQGEKRPKRHAPSKRFIPKVMFLSAICRPQINHETGEVIFDGKIGIFPF